MDFNVLRVWKLASALLFFMAAAGAWAQEDPARRAAVDRVFEIADAESEELARAAVVQRHLDALQRDERSQLEADIWWRLRAEKRISRAVYIERMLDLNQTYFPDDFATLDYWRYIRVINNRQLRGEIDNAEFLYLQARKAEQLRLVHAADDARERATSAARVASEIQLRQAQKPDYGQLFRALGGALRPQTSTECYGVFGTVRCTTR